MWRTLGSCLGIVVIGLMIVGPVLVVGQWDHEMRNFRTVQTGVLYRSGQMSKEGLERIVHEHLIRTVISLRDAENLGDPPPDLAEEEWCEKRGIAHYRLRPAEWWAPSGRPPADANVEKFRKIMDNPANHPVLVHCFAGIHRAGTYSAIFRMEYQGWTCKQAFEEMKACGYTTIEEEEGIRGYLKKYVPTWRQVGLDKPPSFSTRVLGRKAPPKEGDPGF